MIIITAIIVSIDTISLRKILPAITDTTVVIFENTVVFATGRCVFAKFRHKNAITDENTPRYNIAKVYVGLENDTKIAIGLLRFSTSEIKTKETIPITVIAYVRSKVENSDEIFRLEILYATDEITAPTSRITPCIVIIPSDFPEKTAIITPITESDANRYCRVTGFSPRTKMPQIIETIGIIEIITPENELVVIFIP